MPRWAPTGHSPRSTQARREKAGGTFSQSTSGRRHDDAHHALWDKLLRFTGNRSRGDLLVDIGLGKRIATIVAKRMVPLLADGGEKPDPLLMSRERFTAHENISQGGIHLDGSESATVQYANCCRPVPGEAILGYLGKGEGLVVHSAACAVGQKLLKRDSERFIAVDWSDEPTRIFDTGLVVTVSNGKGILARVANALAAAEADISHVDMAEEMGQDAADLRFIIGVRDATHLESIIRQLKRTPAVLKVERVMPVGI